MPNFTLNIAGRKLYTGNLEIISPSVQWYMQREDEDVNGSIRSCAPCPAVWVMKDDPHAFIGRQLQYYIRAANYNMTIEDVYLLFDVHLAFANGSGFRNDSDPRADWFHNRDLGQKPPNLDKVRTTSRSVVTGVEKFLTSQALLDFSFLVKQIITRRINFQAARSFYAANISQAAVTGNVLEVAVFDSRALPILKPGYEYPMDISEVDPNAYAIMPQTHPEMFLVANIVNRLGEVVQFPRGATYPWIDGGLTPYSFVPHIANLAYGPVQYPMRFLYKVPLGAPKPRALRYEN